MVKQLLAWGAAAVVLFTGILSLAVIPTAAEMIPGDLDGSRSVTMRDALQLYRMASGVMAVDDAQLAVADYNGDGIITLRDALALYQYVSRATPSTTTTSFVKVTTTTQTKVTTTMPTKATTTTTKPTTTTTNAISEVYRLVNKERAAAGLPALTYASSRQVLADVRAKEISVNFAHTRPDGRRCFTVFEDYGFSWGSAVAENIAMGYSTPAAAVDGWMHSEGHRKNILSTDYTHIIVGYDPSTKAWVQLFYRP